MAFRVLIVDDSPAMRNFIRRVMDLSGFPVAEVLEANNGREALEVLSREWVDVLLTDINMPEMNGVELVAQLAESEVTSDLPVLVISTDATEHRVMQMKQLGARGYLSKPFSPEQLRGELEQVLGVADVGC